MKKDKGTNLFDVAKTTLLGIAQNISKTDKLEACVEHMLSQKTIDRYLSGDVRDLDTATKLIQFFKERISEREKTLAA